MAVKLTITFIMTPVLVHNLGKYDYGLWEMIMAVIGYMGLLDLGTRPAISRFAAKYNAESDKKNLNTVYSSTFVFFVFVGVLIAAILGIWGIWFGATLAPEGAPSQRYTILLLILACQLLIVFPGYVAESYLEGFQKYYLKNNITIFNSIVGSIILYQYITPENGLLLLAFMNAIGMIIKYIIYIWLLTKPVFGAISFETRYYSWHKLKELLWFGMKSSIQGISDRIENATDTIVIGLFMGPSVVPLYSIPQNLVHYIRTLGQTMSHAFMPLFSDLSARSEQGKIQSIYLVSSKIIVGLVLAMGIGAIILGTPFLNLWLGPDFTGQSDILILLLVSFTITPMLNPFSSRYLTAIGKHGIFAKIMPFSAVANLGLSIILVRYMGIVGVAIGSLIPALIVFPVFLKYSCRELGFPVTVYIRNSLLPLLLPVSAMALVVASLRWKVGIENYFILIVTVVLGAIIYSLIFWYISFTGKEREYILKHLPLSQG